MSIKAERVADMLVEQISYILANNIKNKGIDFVTITDAKVSNDLGIAKIYFTVLDESRKEETQKILKQSSGFIRHELRDRVEIRQIPELTFIYDESIAYGRKIENILDGLKENK